MKASCDQQQNLPLVEFLQSLCDAANSEDKQRIAATYRKAIRGIKSSKVVFTTGAQARKEISGIGPVLEKKIQAFFTKNGVVAASTPEIADKENTTPNIQPIQREPALYVPRISSGPWIVLKSFTLQESLQNPCTKEQIIAGIEQQNECKSKAWRSVSNLIKRGLIVKKDDSFTLTANGIAAASKIKSVSPSQPALASLSTSGSQRGPGRNKIANRTIDGTSKSVLRQFRRLSIEPEPLQSQRAPSALDILDNNAFIRSTPTEAPLTERGDIQFSKVLLVIDTREMQFQGASGRKKAFLKEKLDEMGVASEVRNLSVGDMIWIGITDTGVELVLDYVVERKAIDDLCSSIIDGRYVEQKYRLQRSNFKKVIYLLEGNTNQMFCRTGASRTSFTAPTLHKALCSTQICAGFKTHQTKDLNETATFLRRTTAMLKRKYVHSNENKVYFARDAFDTYSEYHTNNAKTGELSVQDLFAKQLLQITGCSPDRVFAIVQRYPTLPALYDAFKEDSGSANSLLADIVCGEKQRKLGPVLAKRICQVYTKESNK